MKIIENTDEAKNDFHSPFHGGSYLKLSKEELQALIDGKCLAHDVCGEYGVTIELAGGNK